ncbi:hypothetical protein NC652_040049 [Populus alba x Populus x berolinensis]|nr:hypothetical protein NC652_040049 [Populus alba x Populus x berolinensis]
MILCSCLITEGLPLEGVVTATWCLVCSSWKGVKRARRESKPFREVMGERKRQNHMCLAGRHKQGRWEGYRWGPLKAKLGLEGLNGYG